MKLRNSPGYPGMAITIPLFAVGFLLLTYTGGSTERGSAGVSPQGGIQPKLEQPPLKLDPNLEKWKAMVLQSVDRTLKAKIAATDEARRSRQLRQETLFRADAVTATRVLPPATPATEPLKLVSVDPGSGEPGDSVRFFFNQRPGAYDAVYEAHFIVAQGRDERASGWLAYTQDNRWSVVAQIPTNIIGVAAAYNGRAYMKIGAKTTNTVPFTFKPTIDQAALYMTRLEWLYDSNLSGQYGGWFDTAGVTGIVCHKSLPLLGDKGDDEFWRFTKLKNGWMVDHAKVEAYPAVNNIPFGCSVTSSHPGTNILNTKVHWWFESGVAPFVYYIYIFIKGPAGVSYK